MDAKTDRWKDLLEEEEKAGFGATSGSFGESLME